MTSIVDWQLLVDILGAIHARLLEDELTIHHVFIKAFKTVGNNELGMLQQIHPVCTAFWYDYTLF